jgi:hypothetical protein
MRAAAVFPPVGIALLAFCCGAGKSYAQSAPASRPVYEIEARLDTRTHTITAAQTVTVVNSSPRAVEEINFNIFPHRRYTPQEIKFMYSYGGYFKVNPFPEGFQSGDLRILSVNERGSARSFTCEQGDCTLLTVKLAQPLPPGGTIALRLDFQVEIPHAYGRFGWHNGIIALNRWYPLLTVLDREGYHKYPFYLYHHPYFSDAAVYKLSLTVPDGETVVSSGILKSTIANADGTKTLRIETAGAVRDFSLGVSRRFRVYSLERDGVRINSYYLKGDELRAREAAEDAAGVIAYHSARFVRYPYGEFNIVPCYLGYGGENSSAFIFIDTRVYRLPRLLNRYFDFLISHETGHQWFYNLVGSDEYREMFLDEGVNSYWTIRYLEDKYGYNAMVMELPALLKPFIPDFSFRDSAAIRYLYMARNGLDRPVIGELSSFQEPSSIFALAYGKGQAVLDMLDRMVGRGVFDNAMKRYVRDFTYGNASLKDLVRVFSEESGKDLRWFFDEWLNTKDTCDYAVKKVKPGMVVLEKRGAVQMPVVTRVSFSDGSTQEDSWDGAGGVRAIPVGKQVKRVQIDPGDAIPLDIDRTNNSWPRETVFKPVPLYYFAYDLPMLQDRNAYNAVGGPIFGTRTGVGGSIQKPFSGIGSLSTGYDFNGKALDSRVGYELSPVLGKQAAAGFELFDYDARAEGNSIRGGRLYYRRELWPANYGLLDVNDHVTVYFLHDSRLDATSLWSGREDIREQVYTRRHESVIGIAGSLARRGPYPDPDYGWKLVPVQEFGGHFAGGTSSFWRSSLEMENYLLIWPRYNHKIATRIKAGWGGPADQPLFQMGGADDLRGYAAKTIQGSRLLLGSIEYRLPLARSLALSTPGNFVNLDTVQLAAFFDAGKAWNSDFSPVRFHKDAGLGIRLHFDTIGFLEKTILRLDGAKALEGKKETRFWLAISQTF